MVDSSTSISPAQFQYEKNVNAYISLISLTILLYDYGLTLRDEVAAYWGSRLTWASVLFYVNRYVSIVGNTVPLVLGSFWATPKFDPHKIQACRNIQTYHQYFSIVAQMFVAAMLIMRTYALYERNRYILFLTTGIAVAAVAVGGFILYSAKDGTEDFNNVYLEAGCASGLGSYDRRFGFGWMGMLVIDIVVFLLTAWKAIGLSRRQRAGRGLFAILLRDDSRSVMMASNCGNILSFFPYLRGVATAFTNVISSVMISRLMLNVRLHSDEYRTQFRTGESTTLFSPPLSTVVDPYYPTNHTQFADSRFDDGRGGVYNDVALDDLRSGDQREP
ncbi:hypothetical protein R3P38DRAFT_3140246 [Favolaschia claudopus]|uniref:DUF6533 domain-containing protein n=1 Tax=Favolaschia claudopus TaxID=2862362 RepID=A0AAV9Z631_9AGAR